MLYGAADVDVLLITGMRDEAPVATLSHLVPDCRLLEVCVKATKEGAAEAAGDDESGLPAAFVTEC